MTLKREIIFPTKQQQLTTRTVTPMRYSRISCLHVVYRNSSFYGPQSKSCWLLVLIREYTDTSMLSRIVVVVCLFVCLQR